MKSICFVIANIDNVGGTERVCVQLANLLAEKNFDVRILSICGRGRPFFNRGNNVKIDYLNFRNKNSYVRFFCARKMHRYFLKNPDIECVVDVDSVHCDLTTRAIAGLNIKHVSWEHFNHVHNLNDRRRNLAIQTVAKCTDKYVVLTIEDYDFYTKVYGFKAKKVEQIYNPVSHDVGCTADLDAKCVVAAGRLSEQKGFDLLLKAWKYVENKCSDWKLEIWGNGDLRKNLEMLRDRLQLKNVEFKNATSDAAKMYEHASIFVLSSRYEGYPLVLLEALSAGMATVAFDCPTGPGEIIQNEENGLLVEAEDTKGLSQAIVRLINDKSLREGLSKKAILNPKGLSDDEFVTRWIQVFESIS